MSRDSLGSLMVAVSSPGGAVSLLEEGMTVFFCSFNAPRRLANIPFMCRRSCASHERPLKMTFHLYYISTLRSLQPLRTNW